jgi:hypothetical protein
MGVAEIDDLNGAISTKIFPPRKRPISFESDQIECDGGIKYVRIKGQSWYIRDLPYYPSENKNLKLQFGQPEAMTPNPKCGETDPKSGQCRRYVDDAKVKHAVLDFPLKLEGDDQATGDYALHVDLYLTSEYYHYGIWGAAHSLFLDQAHFQAAWRLRYTDRATGRVQTMSLMESDADKRDDFNIRTSLNVDMPIAELIDLVEHNGFTWSVQMSGGEMSTPFHSYNVAGLLQKWSIDAGAKTDKDVDNYVVNTVLRGAPANSLPFRVAFGCTLIEPKNEQ